LSQESSSSKGVRSVRFRSPYLRPKEDLEDPITDRQQKVTGFDQQALEELHVTLVGAGGLGTEIGEGLVRKGVGKLDLIDHDTVQLSNLNRQKFYEEDIYCNKARALAHNLVQEGGMGTVITPYADKFSKVPKKDKLPTDIIIAAVDNNPARRNVAEFCRNNDLPGIFTGVSLDADHGYVFIQEPGGACFGCAKPEAARDKEEPCPGSPAVKDILKLMGALVIYTVDTLVMDRNRKWNYREVYLADPDFDSFSTILKKESCPICGAD